MNKNKLDNIDGCFLGLAVGDALGVPVEFKDRDLLRRFPLTTMTGNGTWGQPPGTWSDDSSLCFCLAESLVKGYDLNDIGNSFVRWMKEGYWGAHHKVFDIGGTTRVAIQDLANGESPLHSGNFDQESNGNGSLMRIVPASIFFHGKGDEELHQVIQEISAITHAHFRSVFSCFLFSKLVQKILNGFDMMKAYEHAMTEANLYAREKGFYEPEIRLFERLLSNKIYSYTESEIYSSGYVLHTLEASIWCFLKTTNFSDAVLKAVNLGEDTDTTGCVTGALAGLYYGIEKIPVEWINAIARRDDIIQLSGNFSQILKSKT